MSDITVKPVDQTGVASDVAAEAAVEPVLSGPLPSTPAATVVEEPAKVEAVEEKNELGGGMVADKPAESTEAAMPDLGLDPSAPKVTPAEPTPSLGGDQPVVAQDQASPAIANPTAVSDQVVEAEPENTTKMQWSS